MRGDKFKGKSFGLKCAWQYHSIIHEDEGEDEFDIISKVIAEYEGTD